MIRFVRPAEPLAGSSIRWRLLTAGSLLLAFIGFACIDPVAVGRVTLMPLSCNAATGVPCLLCGLTRALHYLCTGNFERALYFNWLAFPVAAFALLVFAAALAEAVSRRRVVEVRPSIPPRATAYALLTLALLWSFQVWLAVHGHKAELLNPNGPLYSLFVR